LLAAVALSVAAARAVGRPLQPKSPRNGRRIVALPGRRVWFLAVTLVVNSLLLGGPRAGEAYACTCAETRGVEEALERSSAVFSGKATKVEEFSSESPETGDALLGLGPVTFEVQEAWKGASGDSVVVYGQGPGISCGLDFERGETYLVYAYRIDGYLGTDYCGRTKPLSYAGSDISELKASRDSLPETGGPRIPIPVQVMIAAGAAAALLAVAALAARRPRRE
jgi:hypothetical protein